MVDISTTIATIKALAGVARQANKIDLYNDIISLQQTILELIADNTKGIDDNARLTREVIAARARVAALEAQAQQREQMVFRTEAYWRVREGDPDEGPFCPKCYDGNGNTSRMTDRGNGFTCCVVCKHCYGKARPARPIHD